ncbi:hypothetical protein P152DRAFT_515448 [Eremomyces bilateralis CBS 781.70]|uniref:Uncharacterized protein n=1 Tax=Eremomyces bilateralis CBS 781.70 TaxID=1392243 RepID=A0A6G1FYU7_9PEZI|nr:uncharacterized protein P152DRAFT_515448 [Eremomyces bilateralis CBS 781.70]KAF1811045.1 hypothetical protein P152DRAFT_515448 [Eremomyces bilateralis CBS 781.70]
MAIWSREISFRDPSAISFNNDANFDGMVDFEGQAVGVNQTDQLIKGLVLERVKSVRTTRVGVGIFALVMTIILIGKILVEGYGVSKLEVKLRPKILRNVNPAVNVFLILGVSLAMQNIVFIAIQSASLDSIEVNGCSKTVQIIFPIAFLSGYVHLVFGVETTIRSLKYMKFMPRSRRNTPFCLVAISSLLLATWLPTALWKIPDVCLGDILFRTVPFNLIGLVVLSFEVVAFALMIAVIAIQLKRVSDIEPSQRVAASRMVFRLFWSICLNVLVLPFFIQAKLMTFDNFMTTSGLGDFALLGNGVFITFEYFVYRMHPNWGVIQAKDSAYFARKGFRGAGGAGSLDLRKISPPLNQPYLRATQSLFYFRDSEKALEKRAVQSSPSTATPSAPISQRTATAIPLTSPSRPNSATVPLLPPTPVFIPASATQSSFPRTPTHKRKPSYSLFPQNDSPRLPATVYSPAAKGLASLMQSVSSLKKNQSASLTSASPFSPTTATSMARNAPSVTDVSEVATLMALDGPSAPFTREHRRFSSSGSSATVQIGLRFSVAPEAIAAGNSSASKRVLDPSEMPSPLRRELSGSKRTQSTGLQSQTDGATSSNLISTPQLSSSSSLLLPITAPANTPEPADSCLPSTATKPKLTVTIPQPFVNKNLPPTPRAKVLRMNPVSSLTPQLARTRTPSPKPGVRGEIGLAFPLGGGGGNVPPAPGWI